MILELSIWSLSDDFRDEGEFVAESCIEIGKDFFGVNKYFPHSRSER